MILKGVPGFQGPKGEDGAQGPTGRDGFNGIDGRKGTQIEPLSNHKQINT